jgi:dipeptidyl aminopeptidase/acylaminoacyl peptidase
VRSIHRLRVGAVAGALALVVAMVWTGSAFAVFPGANGKIAVSYDPPPPGGITSIASIDPAGAPFTELTSPGAGINDYDPSYSADGERIAFIRVPQPANSGQVWTMAQDGTDPVQLTAGTETAQDFGPEFSPDGQWIVFDRYNGVVTTQVWIMRADGSEQTQLTSAPGSSRSPSFSPDGTKIVFSRDSASGGEIWVMNADGGGETRLTTASASADDRDPSFSPDGQRVVFVRDTGTSDDIWVMNADGSGQTPVASAPQTETSPTFAPDGTKIAFLRLSSTAEDLYTVDPDGGNLAPVPGASSVYEQSPITWQPLNAPACDVTGAPKQKSFKQIEATVTCSNENAAATLFGTGEAKKVAKVATASKKKRFEIPPVSVQVPAGVPTQVSLPIPKKGRKALKRAAKAGKKGKATITGTMTDDLGQNSTDTFEVKFKKKKK